MKKIYKFYKNRLIEISGRSRSLYSRKVSKKTSFDVGKLLDGDYKAVEEFTQFLWSGRGGAITIVGKDCKERICRNLKVQAKVESQYKDERHMKKAELAAEVLRRERIKRDEEKKAILGQVNDLKTLKREIEEVSRETGKYELFLGYPFVEGSIGREMIIRAPLLLFPVTINIENETTATLELRQGEPIQLNKVFALAYAQKYRINTDDMNMEFSNLHAAKFKNIDSIISYMRNFGFKIGYTARKGIFNFEKAKEPYLGDPIEVKHYAVLGRFPLANAIYNDYNLLEKRKVTNAIEELLASTNSKKIKKPNTELYAVNSLDFAQEDAISKLNQNGNMVIYGPPGTGKSQTIVNVITDALCKNKRVLVVSQKKAALDVVYNRLGSLNERVMYIVDPEKAKADFYARTKATHHSVLGSKIHNTNVKEEKYHEIQNLINIEADVLQCISDTLFSPTAFGPSLQEMYANGNVRDSLDRSVYESIIKNPKIMKLTYGELDNALRIINEKKKHELYYKKLQIQIKNPLIEHIKNDLDVHTINTAKAFITKLITKRIIPFNMSKYPNARQLLAFYLESGLSSNNELRPIMRFIARTEKKKVGEVAANFEAAMEGFKTYVDEYALLETILDKKGFAMTLEGILSGNLLFLRLALEALVNYVAVRDMNLNIRDISEQEFTILNFAYEMTGTLREFKEVINKIMPARIYHELINAEEKYKKQLSRIMDYENVKNRIVSLKGDQREVVREICLAVFKRSYNELYNSTPENKNFLYQITKAQNFWPIRRLMEIYGDLMLTLFPCWLLSPEDVSTIMPLKENLFDLILFDEASQIFIESTLPTIYRGKYIVVAGDNKQLRPSAQFIRRYMGTDMDDLDLSTQAALEVESLLDLATSRYGSVNLNYHYRSKNEEFISFSNYAFYDCQLQIAPNLSKNTNTRPIKRIKVTNGRWVDRKNKAEGSEVIKLLKKIFNTRKENETIGIVTFNAEQEQYIEDLIDEEGIKNTWFRNKITKEMNRRENGEDVSLFIKNIENVQGDERDIIIFSIGYAVNEQGKVSSHFGPLNVEGGENRLNVAITRAKKKIYVITSIEPEELNVADTKNMGPKIFKKYLQYVRAVSSGNNKEAKYILESFGVQNKIVADTSPMVCEMKAALEKLGYTVETNLGSNSYKLSLAVYDKKLDTYLVGVECDDAAYRSSESVIERDVFRSVFMESRGWKIIRVWSRDWWLNPNRVINQIDRAAKRVAKAINNN